jgi:hypothetical protein
MLAMIKRLQNQPGGGVDRTRYFHQQVDGIAGDEYRGIIRQYR